jgi:PAS domain S-box-containing protein
MTGKPVKTILLVDDEAIIAMSEARMLEKHGYKVITAYTGEQAIKTAAEITSLDLILMDIDLGSGMDGTQAADIILKNMDIPVLFLSSHTEPEVVDKTEKITSYGYVVKNSGETVLLASIRMAFKLHAAHRELRKREEALSKSENKLALIFENTPNAINIIEMETGTVVDANKGIEWTGWTREEVIGKSPAMLQSWLNPNEEEIIRSTIRSGGILSNHRVDFHKKDGSVAHGLMNSIVIEMDNKQYLLTITNDITRLIDSESELRRTKEELEGTNEELNAAVEELEATNEELQATNEELEESKHELESLLAENNRIVQTLRENEYFLEKTQEIGRTGSFITEFTAFNPTKIQWKTSKVLNEIFGIDADYMKTRESWLNLIVDPHDIIDGMRRAIEEKRETFELEYQIKRHRDGELRWIYSIGKAVFDGNGVLTRIIGTVQDVTERKNFEISLRLSEERFSDLVQLLPETVFEADRKGRITFVNQAGLQRFGYSREDIDGGIYVIQIIAPEDHQRAFENIERIMKGERSGLNEYTALKKDGTPFPVLVHSSLIVRDGKPEGLRGFLVDISERRLAEKLLLETETRYRSIITSLPIGMHLYRLEPDGRLVFEGANPAADRILGVDNSVFIGRTIEEAFPALAETEVPRRYREVATTGAPWFTEQVDYDENSIRGAFEVHAFRIGGNRMAAAFTDITERKRAEEKLRESEQRWQFALEGAGDGVWDWNAQTDRVYFSHRWKAMLGYDDHEIGDNLKEWDSRVHPDDHDRVYAELDKHLEGKTQVYISEHRIRCKNGEYKWILDRGKVISRTPEGKPLRVIGTHTDISELKRNAEALGKAVSEKEALLRELQHRMKNSLAMISGIINLEHERVRDKNLRGVLGNIKGRIESLSSLYALLFQSDTVREVDLGMYIRSIAGLLMDSYGKGRNIRINQSYDPLQVNTKNAAAWGLIVNELLTNSFKYAFPAGRAGDVAISLKKIGGEIVLAVSDNGTGLPADFNIHNPQGLGLMLVKTLTLQLKGILDFERKELNTFLIRVPDAG